MFRNTQNSGLGNPIPRGKGITGNFTVNYFDGKCMQSPDLQTKLHFCQPPHVIGLGQFTKKVWGQVKNLFCQELCEMFTPSGNESHLVTSIQWGQFTNVFVFDIIIFCALDPKLPTFCDNLGNWET